MENNSSFAKIVYLLALIATIIGFTAFSQKPGEKNSFRKEQPAKDYEGRLQYHEGVFKGTSKRWVDRWLEAT